MILIAHRGNISGPNPERENHPDYIEEAFRAGYFSEIDVWVKDDKWYLGHDMPRHEVNIHFLYSHAPLLWCHAKNIEALRELSTRELHCFWHQNDDVALTSQGYLWTYPGKELTLKSICVKPETIEDVDLKSCAGICSDYIENYRFKERGQ